jgi:GTP cyclohydrolase I
MFEKLRKVTRVKDLDEIIVFKNDQESGKNELVIIGDIILKSIDEH